MNILKHWSVVGALVLAAVGGGILAQSPAQDVSIEVRRTQECVVLHTIHRGPLDKVGALGKFTDVRKLPSVEVVVAVKPEGLAIAESK
jgi:hypothetical protein